MLVLVCVLVAPPASASGTSTTAAPAPSLSFPRRLLRRVRPEDDGGATSERDGAGAAPFFPPRAERRPLLAFPAGVACPASTFFPPSPGVFVPPSSSFLPPPGPLTRPPPRLLGVTFSPPSSPPTPAATSIPSGLRIGVARFLEFVGRRTHTAFGDKTVWCNTSISAPSSNRSRSGAPGVQAAAVFVFSASVLLWYLIFLVFVLFLCFAAENVSRENYQI